MECNVECEMLWQKDRYFVRKAYFTVRKKMLVTKCENGEDVQWLVKNEEI